MKIIALSGTIGWDITANSVREALVDANGADVDFHISGPGGLVYEGIEIYNIIRGYAGRVEFTITGIAASMMSYIALSGDKVKAYDNATFMIHNPWNFAVGDYNDMQNVADNLKGLTGILAKEYIKKTAKTVAAMKILMDKDSYFFGDDMLTEGFVDEILEAPEDADGDNDKASAIIKAQAVVQACYNRMRESDAANADMQRAVAYMDGMSALLDKPAATTKPAPPAPPTGVTNTPAVAGQGKQEDKNMTFDEYLAANPAAQKAHDDAIAQAFTDGKASATDEMKAVIKKVSPQLSSPDYGADVKDAGIKAITGEGHISTFDTLVIMADRDIEAAKAAAAKAESEGTPETPAAAAGSDAVKDAEAKAVYDSKKERLKGQGV